MGNLSKLQSPFLQNSQFGTCWSRAVLARRVLAPDNFLQQKAIIWRNLRVVKRGHLGVGVQWWTYSLKPLIFNDLLCYLYLLDRPLGADIYRLYLALLIKVDLIFWYSNLERIHRTFVNSVFGPKKPPHFSCVVSPSTDHMAATNKTRCVKPRAAPARGKRGWGGGVLVQAIMNAGTSNISKDRITVCWIRSCTMCSLS